jgi:toxin FitB
MIVVLDTNVVSELMKREPNANVSGYVDSLNADSIFIIAITVAEVRYGIARLPIGARREALTRAADALFELMNDRVLNFNADSGHEYGELAAGRESIGRPISPLDAMIAAICREVGATLITRNVADFADTGVTIVDPWTTGVTT